MPLHQKPDLAAPHQPALRESSAKRWFWPDLRIGDTSRRKSQVERILARGHALQGLTLSELHSQYRDLRWHAKCGTPLSLLIEPAFALIREMSGRTLGMLHFPVQLLAGIALAHGEIAEMRTGEGKTLTSLLAVGLFALPKRGCHVYTSNLYLARRDADLARTVLGPLGVTIAALSDEATFEQQQRAYACDVTYGTEKEFGFDFLRDRLRLAQRGVSDDASPSAPAQSPLANACVQRARCFALVDEADSILIDQARTPLIISGTADHSPMHLALFRWADEVAGRLRIGLDFRFDPQTRAARLTDAGCREVMGCTRPVALDAASADTLISQIEVAIVARQGFAIDRDFIIADGQVEIVDESTGRVMEGRKWQNGLQQAIEFRAGVTVSPSTLEMASMTVQRLLADYEYLAGMTGTASQVKQELKADYGCRVTVIPTHRPSRLVAWETRIYSQNEAKLLAVVDEVQTMISQGRAVLIGTPSIRASEEVVAVLRQRGVSHALLHARHHEKEAEIVAQAGQPGRVTVATNMAGRGTDIKLDPAVLLAGGLHVLATQMHASARIDRQLAGRAGRQGDPGSFRFYLSLEDEILVQSGHRERIPLPLSWPADQPLPASWLKYFVAAQRHLEREHVQQRRGLTRRETRQHQLCKKLGLNQYLTQFEDSHLHR